MGTLLSPRGTAEADQLIIEEDGTYDDRTVTLRRGSMFAPPIVQLTMTPHEFANLAEVVDAYLEWVDPADESES